ncbi:hypothetical protein IHV12_03880 [Fictibacillus sp. 7GRE50]|uniref:DUF5658 family protein n=1 Tax=Fictibacillus sp. 7GRE50 TaxID=2745878 RepID=UPI0018CC8D49|nr:DUF5658 family protein [Fictibacillus sp. 7GRE50]MBH0164038.1 hypothetical protein [Fictibacillus sp. 7GRE50]
MKQSIWLQPQFLICLVLAVLNMMDASITHVLLQNGASELNPLMNKAYGYHPVLFLAIKLIFSFLIVWCRTFIVHKHIRKLTMVAFLIYLGVVTWQTFLLISI